MESGLQLGAAGTSPPSEAELCVGQGPGTVMCPVGHGDPHVGPHLGSGELDWSLDLGGAWGHL